jgi:alkyl hydroperoxide reductase subunit AhpC
MALQLGDDAPDFTQDSTAGSISFHDWIGDSWCILFSHPKDFTPVCTTELGEVARLSDEFAKRGCKTVAVSVDSVEDHIKWSDDVEEIAGTRPNYPILADPDRKVADLYGMVHPKALDTMTVRTVFWISPAKKIRAMITYPAPTGRNFGEILRVLDALQLTDQYMVATPVNWTDGDDCIIVPSLTDPEVMKEKFPKGWDEKRPYFRTTPQPNR